MRVRYKIHSLPFEYPFTISRGTKTHQPTLIVELDHMGIKGYGEAPAITYYNISAEQMAADLEAKRPVIEKYALIDPERFWHFLHHLFPSNPFLVCALDMAGWDIYGKIRQLPLYKLWNRNFENTPLTDYTIGIDTIEEMIRKMNAKPWPIYKVKLGTDRDIEVVTQLRKHTEGLIRIDANAAWTVDEAKEKIVALQQLGVEFIEQPLAKDDWEGMKKLYEHSELPLIADESCVRESDVEKCVGHFHGINIKLTKCSGITPALRMIEKARGLGLKLMVGSMNESSIGTAAIVNLLPFLDHVDADGPLLLKEDLATGLLYDNGTITLSDEAGLGISVSSTAL